MKIPWGKRRLAPHGVPFAAWLADTHATTLLKGVIHD